MRIDIRICGEGGQGSIWAATTLGMSAVKYTNLHAAETPFYGPEITGGYSRADVIISDEEVDFPEVVEADLLVAQAQESFDDDYGVVSASGHVVIDSTHVRDTKSFNGSLLGIPASRISEENFGTDRFSNTVLLGFINAIFGIMPHEALAKGVEANSPKRWSQKNVEALQLGRAYVESVAGLSKNLESFRRWKQS